MTASRSRSTPKAPPTEADTAQSRSGAPSAVTGEVVGPRRRGIGPGELDGRKVVTRFVGVVARVPRYMKLGWLLMNDPTVSGRGKAALGGGLAYAVSPLDPVPGFIPVIGQLDDLGILLLAIRTALKSCPEEVAARRLQEAGLSWETLERDLVTLRATAIWVTRRGGALAARAGKALLKLAGGRLRAALPGRGAAVDRA
jgi:uncharacterized membrane protein YkvA (DUF1232 family)